MELYANLHSHSTHSDGVYTPTELVKVAKDEGYKALALSDHDIGTGYPEFKDACEKEGLQYIFAVEFTVSEPDDYHIVGFDFDPEYPEMKEYFDYKEKRSKYVNKCCFEEAVEKGNIKGLTWEEVLEDNKSIATVCNNHIYRTMLKKGLAKQEDYMEWFITNFEEQRGKYAKTFVSDYKRKNLKEMVSLIKAAGGIAVLAHPADRHMDNIDEIIASGVEGIEVWHPDLNEEQRQRAYKIGIEKNLYISGGCDHSGLCGGLYSSFKDEEALKKAPHYIEPLSAGTTEHFFREIKERKLDRKDYK